MYYLRLLVRYVLVEAYKSSNAHSWENRRRLTYFMFEASIMYSDEILCNTIDRPWRAYVYEVAIFVVKTSFIELKALGTN